MDDAMPDGEDLGAETGEPGGPGPATVPAREVGLWVFVLGAGVLGLVELTLTEIVAPRAGALVLQVLGIAMTGLGAAALRARLGAAAATGRGFGLVLAGLLVSGIGVALGLTA